MKITQLIHTVRPAVKEVMAENIGTTNLTWQSDTIAYVIYLYKNKKITDNDIKNFNNLFHFLDPGSGKVTKFGTFKECLLMYLQNGGDEYDEFLKIKEDICKEFELYAIDRQYIDSLETSVVDLDNEKAAPNTDIYTVKDKNGKEMLKSSDVNEARALARANSGTTITNTRNEIVDAVVKPTKSDNIVSLMLCAGAKVVCNGINLYKGPYFAQPLRALDGEYYLYEGKTINGRFPLCRKPELASKNDRVIIGWVNEKDLKRK